MKDWRCTAKASLTPLSERQLEDAIRDDTLLTVRSLSSGFSEVADKAYLSYSQSYSITKFLVETHGQEKMTSLLVRCEMELTIDEALMQTYGFNVEGLEAAWREAIGARPTRFPRNQLLQPTPTFVPTIVPMGGSCLGSPGDLDTCPDLFLQRSTHANTGADRSASRR